MLLSFLIHYERLKTNRRRRMLLYDRKNVEFLSFLSFLPSPSDWSTLEKKKGEEKTLHFKASYCICILWLHRPRAKITWDRLDEEKKMGETHFEQILHLWEFSSIQVIGRFTIQYCIIFFRHDCPCSLAHVSPSFSYSFLHKKRHRNELSTSFFWSSFTSVSIRYPIWKQQIII